MGTEQLRSVGSKNLPGKLEEEEALEQAKPKDPETEDILIESNTELWKEALAGQNNIDPKCDSIVVFLDAAVAQYLIDAPFSKIYAVNFMSSLFSS